MKHIQNDHTRLTGLLVIMLVLSPFLSIAQSQLSSPANLKCEYYSNPIGIDVSHPKLFWEVQSEFRDVRQSAYQVEVASSIEKLTGSEADLWNSGKINSSQSIQVEYRGKSLESGKRYYWRVKTWDQSGIPSEFSEPTWWEMGLLNKNDWKGFWIGNGNPVPENDSLMYGNIPAPVFRKEFEVNKKIKKAKLFVSGLGYFEAYLNGNKISNDMLAPGWTNYSKQVQYLTYDVTTNLNQGKNVMGMLVGNGWYNPLPLPFFNRLNLREVLTIGQPKFIVHLNLTFEDGTEKNIVSDESWKSGNSPILKNNIYLGEVYDARLEQPGWNSIGFDETHWTKTVKTSAPEGVLISQVQPSVRITRTLKPVKLTQPLAGVYIFDMGQNFAGLARLKVSGPAGTKVQLRFGEQLHKDGTLDCSTTAACHIQEGSYVQHRPGMPKSAFQTDTYILKGIGEEVYSPHFTFHGFRYVEVTGFPGTPELDNLEGLRMNSDLETKGEFSCSNQLFNTIHQNTLWTLLSNVFSIESDCPGRERFGYGGDMVTASETYINNFDMAGFYTKAVWDFHNEQKPEGGMPECAPDNTVYDSGVTKNTGPIGWTLAFPWLQSKLYQYYGDLNLITEQYESTRKLIDFFHEKAPNHIIEEGIGDHGSNERKGITSLVNRKTPVTSTAFYYDHVRTLARFARLLDKKEDALKYSKLADDIKNAFIGKFVDLKSGKVGEGLQAYQSMALYYDLIPDQLRDSALQVLIRNIHDQHKGHLATGIFGTKMMFNVLNDATKNEVVYAMNNQMEAPGYGAMIANGATTVYEGMYGRYGGSKNHPMFGSVDEWFYKAILGIECDDDATGFDHFMIKPFFTSDLQWAKGSYNSIRGVIRSEWKRDGNGIILTISVPANTKAEVYCPCITKNGTTISESGVILIDGGKPSSNQKGLTFKKIENGYAIFNAGSGTYNFTIH